MKKLLLVFLITFSACGQDNDHVEKETLAKHHTDYPLVCVRAGQVGMGIAGQIIHRCENYEVVCYVSNTEMQCKFKR